MADTRFMTNTNTGYENAPATKLLATTCCCCNRPLVDAVSVELGIGPDCRKKYMGKSEGHSEDARIEANRLVHQLAVAASGHGSVAETLASEGAIARLLELGFAKLAAKLDKAWIKIRIEETADGMIAVVSPYNPDAVAAAQRIPGRRWDGEAKRNTFPVSSKALVWAMLRRFYAGQAGQGAQGTFVIPAAA